MCDGAAWHLQATPSRRCRGYKHRDAQILPHKKLPQNKKATYHQDSDEDVAMSRGSYSGGSTIYTAKDFIKQAKEAAENAPRCEDSSQIVVMPNSSQIVVIPKCFENIEEQGYCYLALLNNNYKTIRFVIKLEDKIKIYYKSIFTINKVAFEKNNGMFALHYFEGDKRCSIKIFRRLKNIIAHENNIKMKEILNNKKKAKEQRRINNVHQTRSKEEERQMLIKSAYEYEKNGFISMAMQYYRKANMLEGIERLLRVHFARKLKKKR